MGIGGNYVALLRDPQSCRRRPCNGKFLIWIRYTRYILFFLLPNQSLVSKLTGLDRAIKKNSNQLVAVSFIKFDCGRRGIRTPGTVTRTSV